MFYQSVSPPILIWVDPFIYYCTEIKRNHNAQLSRVHNIRRGRVSNAQYTLYKHTATSLPFDVINSSPGMAGEALIDVNTTLMI